MSNGTRDFEEDGFHEIQLSGKQLVFLCMATTVVSIVIFLCGVLVGRGVRPVEPVAEAAAAPVATEAPAVVEPPPAPAPAATHASAAPAPASSKAAASQAQTEPPPVNDAPPADELSYYDELSRKGGKKPAATAAAANAAKADAPKTVAAKAETPKPEPAKPAAAAAASPGGGPVAVQVGAFGSRGEAEKLAKRLSGKGYAAYIVSPEAGGPSVFKVRVGNYQSADEADRVKTRLAREEKLKPWVIR